MTDEVEQEELAELGRATVDGVVVVDGAGRVRIANDAAAALLRTPRLSLVGVDLGAFLSPPLDLMLQRPAGTRIDGRVKQASGGEVPVHIWVRGQGAGVAVVLRDASEWEVARSTLTVVAAGVEHAADGFEITDADGRIEYANGAHAALTGYPLFEVLGERLSRFVLDDDAKNELDAAVSAGSAWRGEVAVRRKDGALRYHDVMVTPVLDGLARLTRFVAIRRDVTDRVELEREAEHLRAELAQAERSSLLGRLAASIAHEVNNPATSILANLDVARDEVDQLAREIEVERVSASPAARLALEAWWKRIRIDERLAALRDALGDSVHGTERVVNLVRDLRAFTRLEAVQLHAVPLNAVVRAAVRVSRAHVHGRARLEVELGDVADVHADHTRLGQVVLNLISTAAASLPAGPAGLHRIDVRTFERGGKAVLVVEDTGPGLAADVLPHVFDPFYSIKHLGEGAALGLAVSRDIVQRAGGDITVESAADRGTRYIVTLPLAARRTSAAT